MINVKRLISSPDFIALLVALFAFLVYLRTLAPTVSFIDSGELAAVACTLGVAHPTGYPLFTLLGWMFSRLPIASEQIVRLNMMAAFLCAAGVFVFFHLMRFVLALLSKHSTTVQFRTSDHLSAACTFASAGTALLLAFSETYWSQAVSVEVYSLHVFFLSVVSLTFLKANFFQGPAGSERRAVVSEHAWWIIFAFTLGLSFTNHMTTILLAHGLLFLYFAVQGWNLESWKRIARLGLPFLVGLSVYLYLPIRATQSPALNWGNTTTLERFFWHISGKQYRVWIFSSTEAAGRQFIYFLNSLPGEFAYVGLILALIGVFTLLRGHRKLLGATALLFMSCVLYSINYDIHDIDSYFLLAYFCNALWAGCGLLKFGFWLDQRMFSKASFIHLLIVCVSLIPLAVHYERANESSNHLVEDYTLNMFASLQANALILSYQWDYWVSASQYYQLVKGVRPDVVVVDKELLRRSWYIKELGTRYPWLIRDSQAEVNAFLRELDKFEHDLPYNPAAIQARYVSMISSFIGRNISRRPVYVTSEIEQEFTHGLQRAPEGLAYRLHSDTLFHPAHLPAFAYRPFERKGRLEDMVKKLYSDAFMARGEYYYRGGDAFEAQAAFRSALMYDPGSIQAQQWLSTLRQ